MNARLYDPLLHRFLAPDNYVQDPYSTQNFNRYGYVLNNPLKYSDPSGEMPMLLAGLAGALISVGVNGVANLAHGENFFHNWGMAALTGFVGGTFSNAIGTVAKQMSGFGKFAFQAIAHAHLGATMTGMSGGNPLHGAIAGVFGSMIGAGAGALLKNATNEWLVGGIMAFSGGVAGGIGSAIAGGSFWDGFRNGFISAGLNHAAHRIYMALRKSLVIGIYGAGGRNAGNNPALRALIEKKGGTLFHHYLPEKLIINWILEHYNGRGVEIYGYSRGGNVAISIANKLVNMGVNVYKLVTFDPHSINDNHVFQVSSKIGIVANFYQRNPRSFWFGSNPFWGSPIGYSSNLYQLNYTGNHAVTHLNIVTYALNNSNFGF